MKINMFSKHTVTARKNQPSSYRFIQANQRTDNSPLDFPDCSYSGVFLEDNQDLINSQFLMKF